MDRRLGIYIHIPFCASKCSYCDFYSVAGCDYLMPDYQKALIKHIRESSSAIKNYTVDSIFFGGGTPSYYGAKMITEIFNELKLNGNVRIDSEVTVECNPDSVTAEDLQLLRSEGVNRISLGVQATDNDLLKLIGRRHNYQQAERAVQLARQAGFQNVSVDLMYGLPSQTKRDWTETLGKIMELHPEHISCYGLQLEEGTAMYKKYKDSPVLPDDDEQADMYAYAAEMLERYGYMRYEISNFAVPGYECRHNLKYWNIEDYMGFGPGAHSCVGSLRYSFGRDLKKYINGVEKNLSVVDEYNEISNFERASEYVMLAMRTTHGMAEQDYRQKTRNSWEPMLDALKVYEKKGWAVQDNGRWHFTTNGFLISNTLIELLLEAQVNGRTRNRVWQGQNFKAPEEVQYPKGEDELIRDFYEENFKQ